MRIRLLITNTCQPFLYRYFLCPPHIHEGGMDRNGPWNWNGRLRGKEPYIFRCLVLYDTLFTINYSFQPVICKPDERTVMKYLISAQNANGVNPTSQETLISSNFSQTETTTIMEYVMLLKGPSPSDLDIEDGSVNQFDFAYGFGNTFGKHDGEGPFSLDLRTSSPTKVPTPPIPTSDPTTTNPITPNPTTVRPTPKPKRGNGR